MADYQPDTRRRLQAAQRFFARIVSFDLECPHCGDVYSIRQGADRKRTTKSPNWDPWTGRFTCTNKNCHRSYVIGLLAWGISKGPGAATVTPTDQVPSPRQLALMRKEGGGWWMAEEERQRFARPDETNLTTEDERPTNDDEDE